jgi:hypothetical protein
MLERRFDMAELGELIERGDVQPIGVGAHRSFKGPSVVLESGVKMDS